MEREDIGSHIHAGKIIPFTAIIYLPFVKERLDFETEAYIRYVGGRVIYARNSKELKTILKKLCDEYACGAKEAPETSDEKS